MLEEDIFKFIDDELCNEIIELCVCYEKGEIFD